MSKVVDLAGRRFDRLLVLRRAESSADGKARWVCACDCGNTTIVFSHALRMKGDAAREIKRTRSCGCLRKSASTVANSTHGMTRTRIYKTWLGMIARCSGASGEKDHKHYRDKGVSVCDEWKSFETFLAWASASGYKDNLTIDRIDNDGDYTPENCRWATKIVQQNNTSKNVVIKAFGRSMTMAQWAREYGIRNGTLFARLKSGWDVEQAISIPVGYIK